MVGLWGLLGICFSCVAPDQPTAVQVAAATPRFTMALAAGDGCARLHIRVGPGSTATVTAVDEGSNCRADELEVRVDSTPIFDAAMGVLRLPIVIRNLGTIAMGAPARLTFIADSANIFDQNGNLLPGKPDIVAHNADSANASARIGVWRYDAYLAPNGQSQVLAPGATSQRRWVEFRSTDWHNAIRISLTATALEPSPNVVPVLPPENIPGALMDSLGSITMPSGQLAVPDLLGVRFVLGATQQQRQAAIDAVRGIVVGGRSSPPGSDGTYYVLIPAQRSDSLLLLAADALLSLPQVSTAEILYRNPRDEAAYQRPHDGAGFERATWNVRSADAAGQNWALERISAPLAWGCATGSVATRVAVVDRSYARNSEVDANVPFLNALPDSMGRSDRHGLRVASILAAPANNSRGIAGVMWQAAIDFRDWDANPQDYTQLAIAENARERLGVLEDHIVHAGMAGAQVINLSRSNIWPNSSPPDTSGVTRAGIEARTEIRNSADAISRALATLRANNKLPLLVIAAGNNDINASYSGYNHPAGRASDSAQVLVVGSIKRSGERDDSSNFGALVSVYAPGFEVAGLAPPEAVTLFSGTSYAAPLVVGAAGLLLSFDPRSHMTAAEMKRLILAGAVDSVAEPNGARKPILDAYGALLKAAKRPGAPLCGNRMWAIERDVFAQRTTGPERIATLPDTWPQPNRLLPMHGGRLFLAVYGGDARLFEWTPNAFVTTTRFPDPLETFKGTTQALQTTHDRDSTVYGDDFNGTTLQVYATALSGSQRTGTPVPVGTPIPLPSNAFMTETRCARFDFDHALGSYVCRDSIALNTLRERSTTRTIPSPSFERVAVTMTQFRSRLVDEVAQDCQNSTATPPSRCPLFVFEEAPVSSRMLVLDRRNGNALANWTVNDVIVRLNTFTEDDTELAVEERGTVTRSSFEVIGVVGGFGWSTRTTFLGETVSTCALVYYDRPSGSAPPATRLPVNSSVCVESLGSATFGRPVGPTGLGLPTPKPGARGTLRARRNER